MAIAPEELGIGEKELVQAPLDEAPELEQEIAGAMMGAHYMAVGLSWDRKDKFKDYENLKEGKGVGDDPDDPMVEMGMYKPYIARLIDIFRAQIINDSIPDPSEMDFFDGTAKWEGIEKIVEGVVALMRDKFKVMRAPGNSLGFIDVFDSLIDDWLTYGCMCGIWTHEALYDHAGSLVNEGPTLNWVDPFNLWPWRTDVGDLSGQGCTIYDPITRAEFQDGYFFNQDLVREHETVDDEPNRDPSASGDSVAGDEGRWKKGVNQNMLKRIVYHGPWPEDILGPAVKSIQPDTEDARWTDLKPRLIQMLAPKFGFDPNEAMTAQYWNIEWIGNTLIHFRPFPLLLPVGLQPVMYMPCIKRNGRFWGYGMYDRAMFDERLRNFFDRCIVEIAGLAARPPNFYNKHAIDMEWLQIHGGELPRLEPDMMVPINPTPGYNRPPFEAFIPNERAIPICGEQAERHENQMRELTGATSAVEGEDRSKTATQNANNLQQSLQLLRYFEKRIENGFLRECVVRAYVICQQSMSILQRPQAVPISYEEAQLRTFAVMPEHMVSEALIDFKMISANSPLAKANQLAGMQEFATLYLPTGALDVMEVIKLHGNLLDLQGREKLLMNWGQEDIQKRMFNLMTLFGPQGLQLMTPQMLALLTGGGGLPVGMLNMLGGVGGQNGQSPATQSPNPGGGGVMTGFGGLGAQQPQPAGPNGAQTVGVGGGGSRMPLNVIRK